MKSLKVSFFAREKNNNSLVLSAIFYALYPSYIYPELLPLFFSIFLFF